MLLVRFTPLWRVPQLEVQLNLLICVLYGSLPVVGVRICHSRVQFFGRRACCLRFWIRGKLLESKKADLYALVAPSSGLIQWLWPCPPLAGCLFCGVVLWQWIAVLGPPTRGELSLDLQALFQDPRSSQESLGWDAGGPR